MFKLLTVRNSLLAITGVSTGIMIWLAAEYWLNAYQQRTDAKRLLASNEVESLLLTGAENWAVERGLAHIALHTLGPVPRETLDAIAQHRALADGAYQRALRQLKASDTVDAYASLIVEIEERHGAVATTRENVDFLIKQPFGPRAGYDYGVTPTEHPVIAAIETWFPAVTSLISAAQVLSNAVQYRAQIAVREIEALQDLKHAVWAMREFAERDRAMIAALIATADPLVTEDIETLFIHRGRLEQAWRSVQAYANREGSSDLVNMEIDRVRQSYFAAFEKVREPIVEAVSANKPYPLSAEDWYAQSGAAMDPLRDLGRVVQTVARELTLDRLADAERRLWVVSGIFMLIILLAGFSTWIVLGRIARPIHRITLAMTALSAGNDAVVVPETAGRGEIGAMARSVKFFKETIEAQHREIRDAKERLEGLYRQVSRQAEELEDKVKERTRELEKVNRALTEKSNSMEMLSNQLAKYLSPQIYQSIFSGKSEVKVSSQRKKLTVFFSDIAEFTETADRLESEDLAALLNQYLTEMSQIALAHGATIDKYVGDGMVIFFGDPETRGIKEDALACVKMALAMREKMQELQVAWHASGIEKPLQCRMGINTGFCTVGNFGSENRLDYTIIGGGVNLASRLESMAAPGEILIAYETYVHIAGDIYCEPRGEVQVRGIAYPVEIFSVIDSRDRLREERRLLHDDHPRLKLDIELDGMSAEQASEAASILREALERVTRVGEQRKENKDSD